MYENIKEKEKLRTDLQATKEEVEKPFRSL